MEAYKVFGADRGDVVSGVEKNRNVQFRRERQKYDTNNNNNNKNNDVSNEEESSYGGSIEEILYVDAKRGQGTHAISRAVYKAGRHVNERRRRRGLNDRPLRVGIIGFPNVGKVSWEGERDKRDVGASMFVLDFITIIFSNKHNDFYTS